ncbi:MAG: hypothetical protein J0I06_25500 [Planctomycetes bacterium]|nr:hypothetical protein [Planctomycetota bacterium]
MSKSGAKTITAIVLALAVSGGALALGGFRLHKLQQIENGPTVGGRATDWNAYPSRGSTVYRVRYAFAHDGAERSGGWVRVSQEVHGATRAGAPLRVRVAVGRPGWHLPEDAIADAKADAAFVLFTGALVLVFVLTALVLVWAAKRLQAKPAPTVSAPDNFPKDPPTGST